MSSDQKKYSVYVAEKEIYAEIEGVKRSWWHSFLLLVDETQGSGAKGKLVQELHFNNDDDLFMEPLLLEKNRSFEWMKTLEMLPLVGGKEADILPLWNHVLKMTDWLWRKNLQFREDFQYAADSLNCRTLVKCVLESMNMDVKLFQEFSMSSAGLEADFSQDYAVFCIEKTEPESLSLSLMKNEILAASLE